MTTIFIGGSRKIGRLNPELRERIDCVMGKRFHILVGDANGADKAVQAYLNEKRYEHVEVFCAGHTCRNNLGSWKMRSIEADNSKKDFDFYAAKDQAMADEADYGLMIWDGESIGTLMNLQRLTQKGKKAVVYVSPERSFFDLKSYADWKELIRNCSVEVQDRIYKTTTREVTKITLASQMGLF
jgi:hypothetical protein